MERVNLLTLAQQGDPRAIAAILNQQLQYRQLSCRAAVREGCLHLAVHAQEGTPDRNAVIEFLRAKLLGMELDGVERVRVYALKARSAQFSEAGSNPSNSDAVTRSPNLMESAVWTHEFAIAVGGYSNLISAQADHWFAADALHEPHSSLEQPVISHPPVAPASRRRRQPTPFTLAIVAIAIGLFSVSLYRWMTRSAAVDPAPSVPTLPQP